MKQLQRQLKVLGVADTANVDQVDAAYQTLRSTWNTLRTSGDRAQQQLATQRLEALEDAYRIVRPFASPVNGDDWADRMVFTARPGGAQPAAPLKAFPPPASVPPPESVPPQDDGPTAIDARRIARSIPPPEPEEELAPEPLAGLPTEDPALSEPSVEEVRDMLMAARISAKQRRERQAAQRWRKNVRLVTLILLLPGLLGVPALVALDAWHQLVLHRRAAVAATTQAPR